MLAAHVWLFSVACASCLSVTTDSFEFSLWASVCKRGSRSVLYCLWPSILPKVHHLKSVLDAALESLARLPAQWLTLDPAVLLIRSSSQEPSPVWALLGRVNTGRQFRWTDHRCSLSLLSSRISRHLILVWNIYCNLLQAP